MIMVGANIVSNADPLSKIQEDYLYGSLRNPKPVIESKIRQLRIVYCLNPKQYALLKRSLPYFVCGIFNPPFRHKDNFAYIDHFILDIDKVCEKGLDIDAIRNEIQKDERVMMCFFTLPSEDGLKVMFKFKERCFDSSVYSLFYKEFVKAFSIQYHLEQVIDSCTSDVSRACFVSMDPNAYYNPTPQPVDVNAFVNPDNPVEFFDLKHESDQQEAAARQEAAQEERAAHTPDPDKDVMKAIREKLNPKSAPKDQKDVYVPKMLDDIMGDLRTYIEKTGIIVSDIKNIQYAKKIQCSLGLKQAEINLFYGKRGFSVVESPKCGTNGELNKLIADLVSSFLNEYVS